MQRDARFALESVAGEQAVGLHVSDHGLHDLAPLEQSLYRIDGTLAFLTVPVRFAASIVSVGSHSNAYRGSRYSRPATRRVGSAGRPVIETNCAPNSRSKTAQSITPGQAHELVAQVDDVGQLVAEQILDSGLDRGLGSHRGTSQTLHGFRAITATPCNPRHPVSPGNRRAVPIVGLFTADDPLPGRAVVERSVDRAQSGQRAPRPAMRRLDRIHRTVGLLKRHRRAGGRLLEGHQAAARGDREAGTLKPQVDR